GEWDLDVFECRNDSIWSGVIHNASGQQYPIIDGIPRLVRGCWLARCLAQHPEFLRRHGGRFLDGALTLESAAESSEELLKQRTIANFSYQWKRFNKMLPIYEANHRMYLRPRGREFFAGKIGLDGGCGTGRHVYYAAGHGAEMVAIDLSEAVEVAYHNVGSLENVHVAQADIY